MNVPVGLSNPVPNLSGMNMRFHTIQQAIDDLAYFAENAVLPMPDGILSILFELITLIYGLSDLEGASKTPTTTPWVGKASETLLS